MLNMPKNNKNNTPKEVKNIPTNNPPYKLF